MNCKENDSAWVIARFGGTHCDTGLPGKVVEVKTLTYVNDVPSWTYKYEGSPDGLLHCDCGRNPIFSIPDAMLKPLPKDKLSDDMVDEIVNKVGPAPKIDDAPVEKTRTLEPALRRE